MTLTRSAGAIECYKEVESEIIFFQIPGLSFSSCLGFDISIYFAAIKQLHKYYTDLANPWQPSDTLWELSGRSW
jgi:hypothetical protein